MLKFLIQLPFRILFLPILLTLKILFWTFDDLGLEKLPTVKGLQTEYAELLTKKKAAYAEYRTARDEMKELLIHKANVEQILGKEPENEEKKNEHERG
ncbi:MAG: hypothetical protein IKY52_14090 [Clostridia bacterium]|nr:hypothetical protein [Clostridia bacterium]